MVAKRFIMMVDFERNDLHGKDYSKNLNANCQYGDNHMKKLFEFPQGTGYCAG